MDADKRGATGLGVMPRSAWIRSVESDGLLQLGAERKPRPMSGSDGVGHALTCLIYTIFVPPAGPSVVVFSARAVLPPIRDPDTRVRFPTVQLLGSTCAIAGRLYSSCR